MWGVAVTMNIYMDQDTCISVVLEEVRKLVKSQGPLSFVIAARSLSLSLLACFSFPRHKGDYEDGYRYGSRQLNSYMH